MFKATILPWQDAQRDTYLLKLSNESNGAYATFALGFGAALNHLVLPNALGKAVPVTLAAETPSAFATIGLNNYYGTLLSPFPNRIKDGSYNWNGKTYQLALNHAAEGHAIHGLVFDKYFAVEALESSETSAKAIVVYHYLGENQAYPFAYALSLTLTFDAKGLHLLTEVTNNTDENIPFGLGWHPYFSTGTPVDQWEVSLPTNKVYAVDGRMIPTGQAEDYSEFRTAKTFGATQLDTCFSAGGEGVTTIVDGDIRLAIHQNVNEYGFLQVYSPADRLSLAIEPMTCAPDAFNNGLGLLVLAPQEKRSFSWSVVVW